VGLYLYTNNSKGTPGASGSHGPSAGLSATPTANSGVAGSVSATPTPTPTPTEKPTAISQGSVILYPETLSCSGAAVDLNLAIELPGSISGSAMISPAIDGIAGDSQSVDSVFTRTTDGSWFETETISSTKLCGELATGSHTVGVLDSSGKTIVEGTFTLEP
jgi:hypothetical protein